MEEKYIKLIPQLILIFFSLYEATPQPIKLPKKKKKHKHVNEHTLWCLLIQPFLFMKKPIFHKRKG